MRTDENYNKGKRQKATATAMATTRPNQSTTAYSNDNRHRKEPSTHQTDLYLYK